MNYARATMPLGDLVMGSKSKSIPNAAAQTRIVSGGPFGQTKESLSRHLKYMAGAQILLEFKSYMPS